MTVQSIEEYLVIMIKDKSKVMLLVIKAYYVNIEFIYSGLGFFESRLNIFLNFETLSVKELVFSQNFNTQTLLMSVVNPAIKYSPHLKGKSPKKIQSLIVWELIKVQWRFGLSNNLGLNLYVVPPTSYMITILEESLGRKN